MNDRIYCIGDALGTIVNYYDAPGGAPTNVFGTSYTLGAHSGNPILGNSDIGHLYVLAGPTGNCQMWELDRDLNLVNHWAVVDTSGTFLNAGGKNFQVYNNLIAYDYQLGSVHYIALVAIGTGSPPALSNTGVLLQHDESACVDLGNGLGVRPSTALGHRRRYQRTLRAGVVAIRR